MKMEKRRGRKKGYHCIEASTQAAMDAIIAQLKKVSQNRWDYTLHDLSKWWHEKRIKEGYTKVYKDNRRILYYYIHRLLKAGWIVWYDKHYTTAMIALRDVGR